jgi:hypothetical protein
VERERLAPLLEVIGTAANRTLEGLPEIADKALRAKIASVGGLVAFADVLHHAGGDRSEQSTAIIELGRQLSARLAPRVVLHIAFAKIWPTRRYSGKRHESVSAGKR